MSSSTVHDDSITGRIKKIRESANNKAPALLPHNEKVEVSQAIEIVDIKEWIPLDTTFSFIPHVKFSLLPQAVQNKRIKKFHPLTYSIKNLLEKDELSNTAFLKISKNDYTDLYTYLTEHKNIHQIQVLEAVALKLKIPKSALKNDFTEFTNIKLKENAEVTRAKGLAKYKNIFKTIENIELPFGYSVEDNYLQYFTKEEVLTPISKIFTIDTLIHTDEMAYYEIKKVQNNRNKKIIIPARDLTDSKKVAIAFADTGEIFDYKKAGLVTSFISEYTRLNESLIKEKLGLESTGWKNGTFYIPQLVKENNCVWLDSLSQIKKSFVQKGELNEQIKMMRELSKGKAFLLSLAGLSSSLYGVIDNLKLNYVIHVGGLKGEGKSLSVKTAISLYGTPDVSKYGRNWNATLNGIETYVELFKSTPSWCDELEAAKSLREVIRFMYSFSESAGKGLAMMKDGKRTARTISTFKGIMFSTGEKNIDEIMMGVGKETNLPLGITRRVLDFKVEELWDGIDKKIVGKLLDKNYGLFITKWIDIINNNKISIQNSYDEVAEKLDWNLDGKEQLFYLMITVLRFLAREKIIDESTYKIQFYFIVQLVNKEKIEMTKTKDIASMFLECASDFLAINANYFMHVGEYSSKDMNSSIYGKIDDTNISMATRIFRDICNQNGLVQNQVIDALKKKGVLVLSNKGDSSKVVKLYKGNTTRCYVIDKKAIHKEEEKNYFNIPTTYENIKIEEDKTLFNQNTN